MPVEHVDKKKKCADLHFVGEKRKKRGRSFLLGLEKKKEGESICRSARRKEEERHRKMLLAAHRGRGEERKRPSQGKRRKARLRVSSSSRQTRTEKRRKEGQGHRCTVGKEKGELSPYSFVTEREAATSSPPKIAKKRCIKKDRTAWGGKKEGKVIRHYLPRGFQSDSPRE